MVQSDGNVLVAFDRTAVAGPVTASLVALWRDQECLLVFNRYRQVWELPGGMLDAGESHREAAFRELVEESGQRPDALAFVGFAHCRVEPGGRLESLAIYRGAVDVPQPFEPNDEISEVRWWHPAEALPNLAPIDEAIARLSR